MKVAVLTDVHFGVHRNSIDFLNSQLRFFREQFIPYLKDNGIKEIIFMGDWYDSRQHTNVMISNEVYKLFSEDLIDFKVHMILGNHDIYFKTTVEVNSLKFLKQFNNVVLYEKITEVKIDKRNFIFVPWIPDHNDFKAYANNVTQKYDSAFGHFEITGFLLNSKVQCESGLTCEDVIKLSDKIYSGHFHTRSQRKIGDSIVEYIGNPYHLTRHDIGQQKGFMIIDLEDLSRKYVENTVSIKYIKLNFLEIFTKDQIEGNIIDIHVDKTLELFSDELLKDYIDSVNKFKPLVNPKIVYSNINNTILYDSSKAQTTEEMIIEYVQMQESSRKNIILEKMLELYNECKKSNEV